MVYILLGTGFEETEAIAPCDLLRRAGVETCFAGIGAQTVTGSHGIAVKADVTLDEIDFDAMQMVVLPGGLRGVQSISQSRQALELVRRAYDDGKYVAAICAAPTILAALGITDGKCATCYPGMEDRMGTAQMTNAPAVTDGTVITGRAAGSAMAFGLALVAALRGKQAADAVADAVVCPHLG